MTAGLNTELLRDVRDAITADVSKFNMGLWFGSDGDEQTVAEACGTSGCIAGWALALDQTTRSWVTYESCTFHGQVVLDPERGTRSVQEVAAERLGLTEEQAHQLFIVNWWPEHYRERVEEARIARWSGEIDQGEYQAIEAKTAAELIDDIIDELTTWEEREETYTVYTYTEEIVDGFNYIVEGEQRAATRKVWRWVYLPDDCTETDT